MTEHANAERLPTQDRMEQAIREAAQADCDLIGVVDAEYLYSLIAKYVRPVYREELAAAEDLARENAARSVETWVLAGGAKDDLHGIAQCLRQRGLHKGALARHDQELTERVRRETLEQVAKNLKVNTASVNDPLKAGPR